MTVPYLAHSNDPIHCILDHVSIVLKIDMIQHVGRRKQHSSRVCHILANSFTEEQAVSKLHDVGLVHGRHLLTPVLDCIIKGKLGDAAALVPSHDLEALHNASHTLMFQGRVLTLRLFSYNHHVHILVPHIEAGQGFDVDNIGVQVKLISESMGTPALLNTSNTTWQSSGPTPSPGIRVAVVRPSGLLTGTPCKNMGLRTQEGEDSDHSHTYNSNTHHGRGERSGTVYIPRLHIPHQRPQLRRERD
ncbi:hypothetical protein E2C01_015537 [Portunus trituberculatus]|uniref:Uncharacterized protein n=1 Tax=Portunus trituberculatus TaxID=210409 RepID=A0A5B7DLY0_PORTR|nr:hypothetical protein [Portunus trituberculatus]